MRSETMYQKKVKGIALTAISAIVVALVSAFALGQTKPTVSVENYKVGPGDVLDINVSENQILSRNGVKVSNRGTIQLPMVDSDISVACKTERELADQIRDTYTKYLKEPHVVVSVQQVNAAPIAMIGAVTAPGRFQLQRPVRVLDLLTLVNGPTEKAGSTIEILRNLSTPYCQDSTLVFPQDNGDALITLSLSDTLRGVEQANPYVNAGDVVRVIEANISQAYVTGSVRSSVPINLKEPVTLSQAIAMAGGLVPGAQADKVIIRRQALGSTNRSEMAVNLKEINSGKREDVRLQPNDIVEVPGPGKSIFRGIIRTLFPTLTSLPVQIIR